MSLDAKALRATVAAHGAALRVVVAAAQGSAPREPGASMTVWADGFDGTIGGGALEFEALAEARRRLKAPEIPDAAKHYPLGPALAQCCGGAATLVFERWDAAALQRLPGPEARIFARPVGARSGEPLPIRAARKAARSGKGAEFTFHPGPPAWLAEPLAETLTPLWVWGAGHVGRAVTRVFQGLPFAITWLDDAPSRFPADIPSGVTALPAPELPEAVALAPAGAAHLVMTYSHALDLEIAHRLLSRGDAARIGVIGSASKATRFRTRLARLGHGPAAIARMDCPIGLIGSEGLKGGKAPAEIAVSVAADHLRWRASRGAQIRETAR